MIYRGIIRDGAAQLPEDVRLPDGLAVEIRVLTPEVAGEEQLSPEEQFKQELLRDGVLSRIARPQPYAPGEDRTLIEVQGEPLSQQIIRERR